MINSVHGYLEALAQLRAECANRQEELKWRYPSVEAMVLDQGRAWKPKAWPKGLRRGEMQMCFKNAYQLAEQDTSLTYVEGFAAGVIPTHHAWCVDRLGEVRDPTWSNGIEYFGVPFRLDWLRRFIFGAGTYGIFFNMSGGFDYMVQTPDFYLDVRWK